MEGKGEEEQKKTKQKTKWNEQKGNKYLDMLIEIKKKEQVRIVKNLNDR